MHLYDDMIKMEYPLKSRDIKKHPPMAIEDRAKIFAPFAALKGYEEAIAMAQKEKQAESKDSAFFLCPDYDILISGNCSFSEIAG